MKVVIIFHILLFHYLIAWGQNYQTDPILPDTIPVALGNTIELYNDDVAFVHINETAYRFEWICNVGVSDKFKWSWKSSKFGIFPIRFRVYSGDNLLVEEESIIKVVPKVSNPSLNILAIGNSLTSGGFSYQFQQISQDLDFTLKPIGTQGTTYPNEGHSGWSFSQFLGSESPFYFNGTIDFKKYIQSNSLPFPDIVRIFLGINDCFSSRPMDAIYQSVDQLINSIKTAYPEALIFIAMPTLCENSGDGWIHDYGNLNNYYPYQLRIRELWRYLIKNYSGTALKKNVRITYEGLCIDRDNGYPLNSNMVHSGGVHPNAEGYKQLSRGFSNTLNYFLYQQSQGQLDIEPPTIPTGLDPIMITDSTITIHWNASVDNRGVYGYKIFVNDHEIDTVNSLTYLISNLSPATLYEISVSAIDSSFNESPRAETIEVMTEKITGVMKSKEKTPEVTLFPNPCRDVLNINYNHENESSVRVMLYNSFGNIALNLVIAKKDFLISGIKILIPVNILPGLYFVTLFYNSRILTGKIFIER